MSFYHAARGVSAVLRQRQLPGLPQNSEGGRESGQIADLAQRPEQWGRSAWETRLYAALGVLLRV